MSSTVWTNKLLKRNCPSSVDWNFLAFNSVFVSFFVCDWWGDKMRKTLHLATARTNSLKTTFHHLKSSKLKVDCYVSVASRFHLFFNNIFVIWTATETLSLPVNTRIHFHCWPLRRDVDTEITNSPLQSLQRNDQKTTSASGRNWIAMVRGQMEGLSSWMER